MSSKITESEIEKFAIELLEGLKYQYIYGLEIAPDSDNPERTNFEEVILYNQLKSAIIRINPEIPVSEIDDAIRLIDDINTPELAVNNEQFHKMLTEGIPITYRKSGEDINDRLWIVDFTNPDNNEFLVCNQFTVIENNITKRLDVILFVNGLPLVVMELKNPAVEKATCKSAFNQFQTYKNFIPSLFNYNGFLIISDGLEAKAGTISANYNRFMTWKSYDGKSEASKLISQLETLIKGMLNRKTLLDLIRHFVVFEENKKEDKETGIITIERVKKLSAYHQYYAVNKAVESTLRASGIKKDLIINDKKTIGDRKGGVIWHTQGSGKSLSMVFYTGKIVLAMNNPTILVITDRNDLDDQLFDTFASCKQLLRQDPIQASSRDQLKELLKVASGGIVFTTIQKFQPEQGNVFDELSNRENIVVIADEAHRTQYGFKAKTIDDKDEKGNVIGKRIVYGFAKYMRDALPNATYLGFTGTPIELSDKNTQTVFGNYVDIYDIEKAVDDGATVKIYYESRLAKIYLSDEGKKLIEDLDKDLDDEEINKSKWTQLNSLIGSDDRIKHVSEDIVKHFEQRQEVFDGKGMIVCISRSIAVDLYNHIVELRPEWHNPDLKKGSIKVVITSNSTDEVEMSNHHTTKQQRRDLADRMKDPEDELKLVIVCDMWLTGFDVPCLHTMYIDKPMKGHNLMQAIARVNRVYKDKPGGLIVDYLGIASDLKKALSFYSDNGGKGDPTVAQEEAVNLMLEKLEVVSQMFYGFSYEEYFDADTSKKLSIILQAEDFILGIEDGKKRFINEVMALSKAFSIAIPHEEAMDVKDEVAFFQAVKSRLVKFESTNGRKSEDGLESVIKQVIDQALITDNIIDIFDAAGIKKPDISILSDEFLMEVKNMEHKNIAIEVLKKLLNDQIKIRSKKNIVRSKSLMELLESSIKRYHNKAITSAEFMEELIEISKNIKKSDKEAEEMGLSDYEYAFYSAVADNESARELMGKDKLRELAVVLFEKVKKNATIDWSIKDSVKSKLKVIIKRTLRQYGYPPDMQRLATETVLSQAEEIAKELI